MVIDEEEEEMMDERAPEEPGGTDLAMKLVCQPDREREIVDRGGGLH